MKKLILLIIALILSVEISTAQKLVIGAKMPDFKGVQWLSAAPAQGQPMYLDFYQSTNPTCKQNLAKMEKLKAEYPKLSIVLLTRENNDAIAELVAQYGAKYSIGFDADGKKYESFGVKFVPFSMVFDTKNLLLWQGNITQLTPEQLGGIK